METTPDGDSAALAELAYTMSVEALRQQERALAELRARTGTLLTAGSIVASFLGTAALTEFGFGELTIAGLVAFGLVLALSLFILAPRRGWNFTLLGSGMLGEHGGRQLPEAHEKLSKDIDAKWGANERRFKCLTWALVAAIVCLGCEAALWAVRLGMS